MLIDYDPSKPLIFIHIPKCAGTSTRSIVEGWFRAGFHRHYRHPEKGYGPKRVDFAEQPTGVSQVVYGHFDARKGLAIPEQYPEVTQFVTILREPLETAVSEYFYRLQRILPIYKRQTREIARWFKEGGFFPAGIRAKHDERKEMISYAGVEDYILRNGSSILRHFPVEVTDANYIDVIESKFVEIGVVEHLDESLRRIAKAIGRDEVIPAIPHLNKSQRHQGLSEEAVARFNEENALAYKVYNYVLARFNPRGR